MDEIKQQEAHIFESLEGVSGVNEQISNSHTNQVAPSPLVARLKARQQLSVSQDSPFNYAKLQADELSEQELLRLRDERAKILREETEDIRRQLELIKNRLGQLNRQRQERQESDESGPKESGADDKEMTRKDDLDGTIAKAPAYEPEIGALTAKKRAELQQRLRPLTGKTDCPNCNCDRRQSVCDICISQQSASHMGRSIKSACHRGQKDAIQDAKFDDPAAETPKRATIADDRPIRPAPMYRRQHESSERDVAEDEPGGSRFRAQVQVNHELVPARIYTIGKSLNEKRSKLAQAIEELESMMDKVRQRGVRLDEERKVAELYKRQWRYGPSVGGAGRGQNYASRLDPELARDTNSLMGFQHIEPSMDLRQQASSKKPRPKPRFAKMAAQTVASRAKVQSGARQFHSRSRSLESLQNSTKMKSSSFVKAGENKHPDQKAPKPSLNRSIPETNLSVTSLPDAIAEEIEEEIEEKADEVGDEGPNEGSSNTKDESVREGAEKAVSSEAAAAAASVAAPAAARSKTIEKLTWVPVFGETEIKTITRRTPKRKTQIFGTNSFNTPSAQPRATPNSILRPRTRPTAAKPARSDGDDGVMQEAKKKLQFTHDLLARDMRDSMAENQLLVRRNVPTRMAEPRNMSAPFRSFNQSQSSNLQANSSTTRARKHLASSNSMRSDAPGPLDKCSRGENRLPNKDQTEPRQAATERCCCNRCICSSSDTSSPEKLVRNLRERLSKTKARLARTLEEERARHAQLEEKVNCSLRKQSDLEKDNEMLRSSLNKCIDNCLRDISTTFESLNETLDESAATIPNIPSVSDRAPSGSPEILAASPLFITQRRQLDDTIGQDSSSSANTLAPSSSSASDRLMRAAQLISDNRNLKKLRAHIEAIERQRRAIFEQLGHEKHRSKQLELELINSKEELDQLAAAKQQLESHSSCADSKQLAPPSVIDSAACELPLEAPLESAQQGEHKSPCAHDESTCSINKNSLCEEQNSSTFNSIDLYRRYIESLSPDLGAIRLERQMILNEFDSIKKMLIEMDK